MNKLLSTYDLTRAPFSKDIPASEMFETDAISQARDPRKYPVGVWVERDGTPVEDPQDLYLLWFSDFVEARAVLGD